MEGVLLKTYNTMHHLKTYNQWQNCKEKAERAKLKESRKNYKFL